MRTRISLFERVSSLRHHLQWKQRKGLARTTMATKLIYSVKFKTWLNKMATIWPSTWNFPSTRIHRRVWPCGKWLQYYHQSQSIGRMSAFRSDCGWLFPHCWSISPRRPFAYYSPHSHIFNQYYQRSCGSEEVWRTDIDTVAGSGRNGMYPSGD